MLEYRLSNHKAGSQYVTWSRQLTCWVVSSLAIASSVFASLLLLWSPYGNNRLLEDLNDNGKLFAICETLTNHSIPKPGRNNQKTATSKKEVYPLVNNAYLEMRVGEKAINPVVQATLKTGKRPAYEITLSAVSLDQRSADSLQIELNAIGKYAKTADIAYEPDLLNPDRWGHGAGQRVFSAAELCGENKAEPNWGARRTFILRRMKIEVTVTEIELNENNTVILRAYIQVRVSRSPSSTRSRPLDVAYVEPKACQ